MSNLRTEFFIKLIVLSMITVQLSSCYLFPPSYPGEGYISLSVKKAALENKRKKIDPSDTLGLEINDELTILNEFLDTYTYEIGFEPKSSELTSTLESSIRSIGYHLAMDRANHIGRIIDGEWAISLQFYFSQEVSTKNYGKINKERKEIIEKKIKKGFQAGLRQYLINHTNENGKEAYFTPPDTGTEKISIWWSTDVLLDNKHDFVVNVGNISQIYNYLTLKKPDPNDSEIGRLKIDY